MTRLIALSQAVTAACSESNAIEQALDEADAEITPANAEDELRPLEGEIDSGG